MIVLNVAMLNFVILKKSHPERLTSKRDKEIIASLDYGGIVYHVYNILQENIY